MDDCSKYCYLYFLRSKDEIIEDFKDFKIEAENQLSCRIKMVGGGEYVSPLEELYKESGIIHQVSPPNSPQSNGVAEHKNRTLKDMMNDLMISSGLP